MPRGIYPRNQNRTNKTLAEFKLVPKSDVPAKKGHHENNEFMEAAKKAADHDLEKAVVLIESTEEREVGRMRSNAVHWIERNHKDKYKAVARGTRVYFWKL